MNSEEKHLTAHDIPWIPVAIIIVFVSFLVFLSCIPFRADFHFKAGKMNTDFRKIFEAKEEFEKAIRISPYESGHNTFYGISLLNVAKNVEDKRTWFERAINVLHQATIIDPYNADNFHILGKVFLSLDEIGIKGALLESISYSKKALAVDPYYAEAYLNLGLAYEKEGKLEDAAKMFTRSFMVNPTLEEPMKKLIELSRKRRKIGESIAILEEAAQKYPSFIQPKKYLAKTYLEVGQINKAIDINLEIQKRKPGNVMSLVGLGDAYLRKGSLNKAKDAYLEAILLEPLNVDAHNGLGTVYYRQGFKGKAASEFSQTLILDPNNTYAKRMLKLLGY